MRPCAFKRRGRRQAANNDGLNGHPSMSALLIITVEKKAFFLSNIFFLSLARNVLANTMRLLRLPNHNRQQWPSATMNIGNILCVHVCVCWCGRKNEREQTKGAKWLEWGANRRPNIKIYLGLNALNNILNIDFISMLFHSPLRLALPHRIDIT